MGWIGTLELRPWKTKYPMTKTKRCSMQWHISYCTQWRKGLGIHCPKLCHFWAIVGQLCQLRGEAGLWLVSCVSWCESCALIGQRPLPGVWRSMSMTYCGGSQELGSPHTSPSPLSLPLRHFLCSFSPHGEGNGLELVTNFANVVVLQ